MKCRLTGYWQTAIRKNTSIPVEHVLISPRKGGPNEGFDVHGNPGKGVVDCCE